MEGTLKGKNFLKNKINFSIEKKKLVRIFDYNRL